MARWTSAESRAWRSRRASGKSAAPRPHTAPAMLPPHRSAPRVPQTTQEAVEEHSVPMCVEPMGRECGDGDAECAQVKICSACRVQCGAV